MAAGADPRLVNAGGEAPAHIVVQVFNSVFDVFEECRRRRGSDVYCRPDPGYPDDGLLP